MEIKLYNATPKHRENFIKLASTGFYDSVLFHRVITDFMIQCGDPDSKHATEGQMLGGGGPGYEIDAEFVDSLIHKKGALAAARTGDEMNPMKKSSGSQFYIVQGKKYSDEDLNSMELNINQSVKQSVAQKFLDKPENKAYFDKLKAAAQIKDKAAYDAAVGEIFAATADEAKALEFHYTPAQRAIYTSIGGTPFLDKNYTVFGEVIEGMDVIDKIASTPKNRFDRPLTNVVMKISILK